VAAKNGRRSHRRHAHQNGRRCRRRGHDHGRGALPHRTRRSGRRRESRSRTADDATPRPEEDPWTTARGSRSLPRRRPRRSPSAQQRRQATSDQSSQRECPARSRRRWQAASPDPAPQASSCEHAALGERGVHETSPHVLPLGGLALADDDTSSGSRRSRRARMSRTASSAVFSTSGSITSRSMSLLAVADPRACDPNRITRASGASAIKRRPASAIFASSSAIPPRYPLRRRVESTGRLRSPAHRGVLAAIERVALGGRAMADWRQHAT